jgi:hypothetical protein
MSVARGLQITNMDELWRFATAVSKSGLAPKGIEHPEAIFVALEMGLEVGLPPMAALQNIAVINGRPSIWGDAQLAVVRGTGELEEFSEWYEANGTKLPRNPATFTDDTAAVCRVKRRGYDPVEVGFSVAEAKTANLWGKAGPWSQYPARMLKFRARSFALRDCFGDALKGLRAAEEVQDDPQEVNVTPTATTEPAAVPGAPKFRRRDKAAEEAKPAAEMSPAVPVASAPVIPQEPTAKSLATEAVEAAKPTPAVVPAPAPAAVVPDVATDPHGFIQAKLDQYGVPFDSFQGWLKSAGHFDQSDSMADINDLPKPVAVKITNNGCEFLRKCCRLYGTKELKN